MCINSSQLESQNAMTTRGVFVAAGETKGFLLLVYGCVADVKFKK